ncbi:cysteine--tRNA ligase [Candidatus Pacearchaeota archaeon]|nr:cysteine--tRNA ligase [Candidatus Pacearchaeota archaeon]
MEKVYFYNTLTRKKEEFKSIKKGDVGIYSCGPTVYWYQHIGNLRTYIFSDVLKRILNYNGYKVKHIINITDVGHLTSDADEGEDKMERAAKKEGRSAHEIAEEYFRVFNKDLQKINILQPNLWVKATDHIDEQIKLIKTLEKKGYTYRTDDGIYFDSTKFKSYGKLANLNISGLQQGKRVNHGSKRTKTDFALWKFSETPGVRQQEWKSPWGVGFPGWHIECSAMSMKYLGKKFDIHTGGQDHIPVHHTNEIAQSEAVTGKKFVNYWIHGAFLLFKGEKMSKSSGGLYTLSELENLGYNPMHFRYLCLLTHYHKPLNFSLDNLDAAKNAYERIKRKIIYLKEKKSKGEDKTEKYQKEFVMAINDDLNIQKALQIFQKSLDDEEFDSYEKLKMLEHFDKVLGLGVAEMKEERIAIPSEIVKLVKEREEARKNKDWKKSDSLRQRLKDEGYSISDTPEGPKIERK